ncbi:MAG: aryl-sulfate sulfotransferase [Chitinispirillaceae bacterium]|nr:aryl-sulfate sulfotransferase [Chitinispirillaceae bacterium]
MKHSRKGVRNRDFSSIDFKYRRFCFPLVVTLIILAHLSILAQTRTVGVISMTADTTAGYTLFAPLMGTVTYLVDNFGREINSWKSDKTSGASDYLLDDGSLLRCESLQNRSFNAGGSGGRVKRTSWDGETMWTYDYSNSSHCQQHDIEYLPKTGTVLLLAWEVKTQSEASAVGRTATGNVWMDHIVEVKPSGSSGGEIVWEWHVWDHLIQDKDASKGNYGVVADHPELVDINYKNPDAVMGGTSTDWLHTNAVYYNEELDQIMISVLDLGEVWIIDHHTTTAEAASHSGGKHGKGGDLLYRFGNPAAYKSGSNSDRLLQLQHDAHWIPKGLPGAGNVLVFNNGTSSRGSSVDEFKLPVDADGKYDLKKAPEKVWSYAPAGFYATNMGSGQRMANGSTLICHGPKGTFYEVDTDKDIVWEYISPVTSSGITQQGKSPGGGMGMQPNQCFRAYRYAPDDAAFAGKNITPPAAPVEGGDLITVKPGKTVIVSSSGDAQVPGAFSLSSYVNSSNPALATAVTVTVPRNSDVTVKIYNAGGREIATLVNHYLSAGKYSYTWSANGCAGGIYFVRLVTKNYATAHRLVVLQ